MFPSMRKDIIQEIRSGNEAPYYKLYKEYRNDFLDWACFSYEVSREEAKDVYQDLFIAFWNNIHSGRLTELTCDIKTYLFSIGKNLLLSLIKKKQRSVTFSSVPDMNSYYTPFDIIHDREHNVRQLDEYLAGLQPVERQVLELYYMHELDMKSIARAVGYKNADVAKKKKYQVFQKLLASLRHRTRSSVNHLHD